MQSLRQERGSHFADTPPPLIFCLLHRAAHTTPLNPTFVHGSTIILSSFPVSKVQLSKNTVEKCHPMPPLYPLLNLLPPSLKNRWTFLNLRHCRRRIRLLLHPPRAPARKRRRRHRSRLRLQSGRRKRQAEERRSPFPFETRGQSPLASCSPGDDFSSRPSAVFVFAGAFFWD